MSFPKIASLKDYAAFLTHLETLGLDLPVDEQVTQGPAAPLAAGLVAGSYKIGNRFCILPMEGWDGDHAGLPSDLTRRRWRNFGDSGAKLIWGGEAVAVRPDGRANPNQLMLLEANIGAIESLRHELENAHQERFGSTDDLLVGLQLTHSGRFARPNAKTTPEPRIAYRHPLLDRRVGVEDDGPLLSDSDLDQLIDDFIAAGVRAQQAGFAFVDVKHCHGYLGHELLSAYDRPGKYGGDFTGRTRFLREIVAGLAAEAPGLSIGVRVSVFDFSPYHPGADRIGEPDTTGDYRYAFGGDTTGLGIDLTEPSRFLRLLSELGISLVCTTAGSPYYNPHIQRPAAFPPSDGYQPPEDPLVGVARQLHATAQLKQQHPELIVVGSGYSYLQDWLPNVAQAMVLTGSVDSIGLGRMVLSYHDLPADVLQGKSLTRKRVCRTFSDCTTAPRNGMVSGCYPLDPFYKDRPERQRLLELAKTNG
ncbi:oxidoreductase [Botrimarina hoheduenensis]|uniref:NADPH dehydrogenase n=1 Tax=Botrimarina hoheduenensis TaxID=2528000 RepID=A0A5C5VT20_9BACT|nr:NADH:flavin oxidoreductase [Botrimarina hoheduenensis]TWT40759.1 NADPH dehydrogenase [Botrimarina hoheduenensis]